MGPLPMIYLDFMHLLWGCTQSIPTLHPARSLGWFYKLFRKESIR